MAPMPSSVTGVTQRSSPPSSRSTRMTSAPRSASNAPQYGPAMNRPKSTTRIPSSMASVCWLEALQALFADGTLAVEREFVLPAADDAALHQLAEHQPVAVDGDGQFIARLDPQQSA